MAVNLINSSDIEVVQNDNDIQLELVNTIPIVDNTVSTSSTNAIENQAITNYVNTKADYSTNEKVIGKWIDNKPLYRKVYKITNGLNTETLLSLNVSGLNIERCIRLDGWQYSSEFSFISLNFYNGDHNYIYLHNNSTVNYQYHWSATEIYIILEYTKTTD